MRRAMPRLAAFLLAGLLPACSYVGSPVDGAGSFIGNTVSFKTNPNRPIGDAPNLLRATGQQAESEPLTSDEGNIWPGPLPPSKTLSDLQREASEPISGVEVDPRTPLPRMGPGATPIAPAPLPRMPVPANQPTGVRPTGGVLQTPAGPAMTVMGGNGLRSFTLPNGVSGTVIDNGNGTATLLGTDGSSLIAPLPR